MSAFVLDRPPKRSSVIFMRRMCIPIKICPDFTTSGAAWSGGRRKPVRSCAPVNSSGRRGTPFTRRRGRRKSARSKCCRFTPISVSRIWRCRPLRGRRRKKKNLPERSIPTPSRRSCMTAEHCNPEPVTISETDSRERLKCSTREGTTSCTMCTRRPGGFPLESSAL